MYKVWLFLFFSLIQHGVDATLTPSGPTVSVDCGGQQTFTCSVTGAAALWTITGLDGITASITSGLAVATTNNNRVTTTDANGLVQTSTITITGFTPADDGGSVQCVNQVDSAVQGMTTISVGPPSCGQVGITVTSNDSCPCLTFTPQGNVLPLTVVMSYNSQGDPSSAGSLTCSYPIDSQMCKLNVSGGTYTVRAIPQNRCGSQSSTCSSVIVIVPANCTTQEALISKEDLSGLYSLLLLLPLLILVVYSISVAVVWHLYYKDYNYCQVYWCCCFCKPREGDGKIRTSSTEPMKASPPPPRPPAPVAAAAPLGEYADPKDVRKRKEENKIQYADLEFTKRSGGGQGTIHQKEEPVTYTAIQHA